MNNHWATLPEKILLSKEHVRRASLLYDLTIILKTLLMLISDRVISPGRDAKET